MGRPLGACPSQQARTGEEDALVRFPSSPKPERDFLVDPTRISYVEQMLVHYFLVSHILTFLYDWGLRCLNSCAASLRSDIYHRASGRACLLQHVVSSRRKRFSVQDSILTLTSMVPLSMTNQVGHASCSPSFSSPPALKP